MLKLYMNEVSPGVRAVFLTAAALNIEINEEIHLNLLEDEKDRNRLSKIHPACTVPSLSDDGFIVNDSHTIVMYLVEKFGKNDELYPKNIEQRSKVNYALFYDSGILFPALHAITMKIYGMIAIEPSEEDEKHVKYACDVLERMLEEQTYTAGDFLSIGDFSVISSMTSLNHLIPLSMKQYPNIVAWMERMKILPYYYLNQHGLEKHIQLLENYKAMYKELKLDGVSSTHTKT